ncbi:MAG TPA: histidine kinase dimerization/phospho-acceptor domain-containing protein, partial [Patescibacteria group bacterium]|nr:histidine kinase dimerization/phospho-acceptor domain-containing protein [Patescibacteria group bacterium]
MEKDKTRLKRPFTRKKQLEQDLAHVNEQMYVKNLELKETLDTLSLLRAIDNLVLESREDLTVLCQNITKAIINYSNYSFIAILVKPPHHEFLELYGLSSATEIKLDTSNFRLHESHYTKWLEELEQTTVIDTHKITSEKLAKLLKKPEPQIESLRQSMHMKSLVLIKLMAQTRLVGLMVVGFNQGSVEISEKNRVSLDRISSAVGIAIDNKLLYEENQRVVRQVKKSNEKLRALDQAKDEFISMASHQLRTPLTSMKGYVSMVMEGDAGKISPPQRKLLDQAFVSSQRMVYLIADLLNVSRLKTGKFVIEPVDS